ncbi:MAG: hypothetical protein M1821_008439 [Bathelium mastoideum]|nr:MAG: hypothetical protein M1821_008439 [Bathelium mastoideum]
MTALGTQKPKRTKRFTTKVKTGCITCKIRRVKCDEEHPSCRRCTSTGRKCDGYASVQKPSPQAVASKSLCLTRTGATLTKISGTTEEARSLEFYFERAAPKISGLLGGKFWLRLVYQIGYYEPAVRHALIAIGYLFEKQGYAHGSRHRNASAGSKDDFIRSKDEFLLDQYNRAIACLIKRMSEASSSSRISIVTCVLFMCLEALLEHPMACYTHFRSGLKILFTARGSDAIGFMSSTPAQENTDQSRTPKKVTAAKASSADHVDETLILLFTRLSVSAMIHGVDESHVAFADPIILRTMPIVFGSLEESWYVLVDLLNQGLKFITQSTFKKYTQEFTPEDFTLQSHLLACLDRWLSFLEKYERENRQIHGRDPQLCSMRLFHRCAWIWLSCCTDPLEMEYDKHLAGFQELVSLGEVLAANSSAPSTSTELDFTYDMEFIAPVFFVVIRCRDPLIRRQAMSLLANRRRREGLWDSERCVVVGERVIALEEAGLCGSITRRFPPAKYRVHDATNEIERPYFRTTFFTLPDGLGSARYVWHETLRV